MRILAFSAAAAALALPVSAYAQDPGDYYADDYQHDDYDYDVGTSYEEPLSRSLSDPAMQDQLASTVAVLGEIMLDLPLAPIIEPIARATGSGSVSPSTWPPTAWTASSWSPCTRTTRCPTSSPSWRSRP